MIKEEGLVNRGVSLDFFKNLPKKQNAKIFIKNFVFFMY